MKVKASKYLHDIKPILLRLRDRLLEEFPYASILATDSQAKQYSVSRTATNIGMVGLWSGRGFVVKVYDGSGYGEYSFNEISEDRVEEIVAKVKGDLIPMSGHLPEGVERSVYAMLEDEPLVFADSTEYEIDPAEYGDEKIIRELTRISETGRAHDERILDCGAFLNYQKYSKLFLSRNRDMEQNVLWTAGGFSVMASRGQEIKRSYKGFSNLGGAELLERMRDGGEGDAGASGERAHHARRVRLHLHTGGHWHDRARGLRPRGGDGHVREEAGAGGAVRGQAGGLGAGHHA